MGTWVTRILAVMLTAAAGCSHVRAQTPSVQRVDVVEYGIYTAQRTGEVRQEEGTAYGAVKPITNLKLVRVSTTIPAELGLRFGMRFVVAGSPKGRPVQLTSITRFPSQGLTNPQTGKTFQFNEFKSQETIGELSYRTYTFDEPWEMATGEWALEFWYDGRKLGEKKFTVVAP